MRAGVIGVGRMGRRHIQMLKNNDIAIDGVCDTFPDALKLAQDEHQLNQNQLYSDASEMLNKLQPEIVVIATTAPSHCDYTLLAASNNAQYILCEKPMAVSLEQCDQMIATCAEKGIGLAINHPMRYMERHTKPKELIHTPKFGELRSMTVVGGNVGLAMIGTHYFETFRYISEENPQTVQAWFSDERVPNPRGDQFEDRAGSVRVLTASGKRFYMEAGADQGYGLQTIYAGSYGRVTVDELRGEIKCITRHETDRSLPMTRYGQPGIVENLIIDPPDVVAAAGAVLKDLLNNGDYPDGHIGRLAIATLVAAHVSAENNNIAVALQSDELPKARVFPWA